MAAKLLVQEYNRRRASEHLRMAGRGRSSYDLYRCTGDND